MTFLRENNLVWTTIMYMEQWKDIPGYEEFYQVSSEGRVKSLNYLRTGKEKELKLSLHPQGYLMINLCKNGKIKRLGVHQLVAMAFLGHVPDGQKLVVDHINSNKQDNSVQNLKIVTQRENSSKEVSLKSSLPTGVVKRKNKFRSQIRIKKKIKCLGYFSTPEEASKVYQQALKQILES